MPLTIQTTGDDAWDTDHRLVFALVGYHVRIDGGPIVEILDVAEGAVEVTEVTEGTAHDAKWIDAANVTIEVL